MPKQPIWNTRMLELMEHCIYNRIRCTSQAEWCSLVGITPPGINQIRNTGKASFRHEHVLKAAKIFNVNINWIYGLSDERILKPEKSSPIEIIQSQLKKLKVK